MTHLAVQPESYAEQLAEKVSRLSDMLAPYTDQPLAVFESPREHYRMRAEFRVWHEGDDLYYIMFDPDTREKIRTDQFPAGSQLINTLMPAVIDYVRERPTLRQKLFQVEFLTTTSGQALISLLYHRQLDDAWQLEAEAMREALQNYGEIHLIGRARKQKMCLSQDWVVERLTIAGRDYLFQQIENSFTQPNAYVNQHMVSWALEATTATNHDLLELYCGNGNFSLPLAQNFERVLATEISKTSVASARYNCELNDIHNVTLLRMSAEDFSAVMAGEKTSRRAEEAELDSFNCQTVLVDPPRAGLDDATVELVRQYARIIYISCNPETLVENLASLNNTHKVTKCALFDQFPYTHHMEAGVIIERR
ncbi:tRNA (uridine(54)-C5)-methyltransferase TrmA [Pseudidiomarina sediminum]|uniref:tRNA/tmRNA (uracil-C(5))-methyltransferase n=1 Tax=Pseudidiomarina sediminum TaxID=431675 RepID=A0A432Z264_9GAMM|nr:tRNA (uridine(54)-C5)-methyltransferase TrmA [Pseudidiomarina sediminum]MBY6064302.1 tRNA (uridine(54)-C5)-methyltransferase TrmA [Pseudidiomarina sediminum]RUO71988.1 tRNA (uridine(54)-C5)-methyltransferase TrmA [Pseudidiomarina sediminum]